MVTDGSTKYASLSVLVGPDTGMIFLGAHTKRMAEHLGVGPNFHNFIQVGSMRCWVDIQSRDSSLLLLLLS